MAHFDCEKIWWKLANQYFQCPLFDFSHSSCLEIILMGDGATHIIQEFNIHPLSLMI